MQTEAPRCSLGQSNIPPSLTRASCAPRSQPPGSLVGRDIGIPQAAKVKRKLGENVPCCVAKLRSHGGFPRSPRGAKACKGARPPAQAKFGYNMGTEVIAISSRMNSAPSTCIPSTVCEFADPTAPKRSLAHKQICGSRSAQPPQQSKIGLIATIPGIRQKNRRCYSRKRYEFHRVYRAICALEET